MVAKHLIIAVLLGLAWAQDGIKDPGGVLRNKCMRNGGVDAFRNVELATQVVANCFKGIVLQTVKDAVSAKTQEEISNVLKNFCARKAEAKNCLGGGVDAVKACYPVAEHENLIVNNEMTRQLVEFVCANNDRLASFIKKDGLQCFLKQQVAIQECATSVMGNQTFNTSLIILNFGEKECEQYLTIQDCLVMQLHSCPQPTTANLVQDLFKYTFEVTPCRANFTGSASGLVVTSLTLIMAAATLLV